MVAAAGGGEDDETWERAISAATKSTSAPKTLTLDGAVNSSTGGLPSAVLLERFGASLEELSVAGACLSSLTGTPHLPALRRLSLPDNHLDLGNNRFAEVQELAPLAGVQVESLDLFQCPVTKVKGYREEVFALIPSLKYLDGADAEGNERLETDDDEDEEEDNDEGEEGAEGEEQGDEDDGEEEHDEEAVEANFSLDVLS
jgi:acidic leucine-rich nuclear phosphoprotein 32 family member B